jgi:DNA-binding transcriptional regulator YdaS (Cro superfamily)
MVAVDNNRISMDQTENSREALDRAAATFGGLAALARLLDVTPQALTGWRLRGRVPATRVLEVERLTGVSRYALRPDIYGESP